MIYSTPAARKRAMFKQSSRSTAQHRASQIPQKQGHKTLILLKDQKLISITDISDLDSSQEQAWYTFLDLINLVLFFVDLSEVREWEL